MRSRSPLRPASLRMVSRALLIAAFELRLRESSARFASLSAFLSLLLVAKKCRPEVRTTVIASSSVVADTSSSAASARILLAPERRRVGQLRRALPGPLVASNRRDDDREQLGRRLEPVVDAAAPCPEGRGRACSGDRRTSG